MSLPKVAICVPYYRTAEGPTMIAALSLGLYSGRHLNVMPLQCSGAYIEANRNGLVEFAMEVEKSASIEFDYYFWIDTDMIFPADALLRLIARDKDIVGPNYRIRVAPFVYAGSYLDGTDAHVNAIGLEPMSHIPTGLMLVKGHVFRRIGQVERELAEERRALFPRAIELLKETGAGGEQATRLLTRAMADVASPWFLPPTYKTDARDDVYFCRRARELGFEVWCDQDLTREIHHRTVQDLGWIDPGQIVYQGAALSDEKMRAQGLAEADRIGSVIRDVDGPTKSAAD